MAGSPAASAEPRQSRIQALASIRPAPEPGEPELAPPPGAAPLTGAGGEAIGWASLAEGRGAVGLNHGLRFDLDLGRDRVRYRARRPLGDELVIDSWERCALPFALASAGAAVLHAAALTDRRGVVAIAGPSGSGKSTLRAELERFGYLPFADDAVPIADGARGEPRATFLPFRPKRGPEGFAGPHLERPAGFGAELPLLAVVVLTGREGTRLRRLSGSESFEALLENAYALPESDAPPVPVDELLALAGSVPVFELGFERTGAVEPATVGALTTVVRGAGLWGGRRAVLRGDPSAALAALPMAARYALLSRLGGRLNPALAARLALAPSRPRLPVIEAASPTPLARLRAASATFALGSACLERSLALARSLADAGLSPEVVVGWDAAVRHGHAWVELAGVPVLDDTTAELEFTELWRCDARGRIRRPAQA